MRTPGHPARTALTLCSALLAIGVFAACSAYPVRARDSAGRLAGPAGHASYAALATRSIRLLQGSYFNGSGLWHMCVPVICNTKNRDWGADALTNLLYFRWLTTGDPTVPPLMAKLIRTAHLWTPGARASSDSVMWDAVAEMRMYQVTGNSQAMTKAEAALRWLGTVPGLAAGACPKVDYQWSDRQRGDLKTIETASNYVKAALLLYQVTGKPGYLAGARAQYADVRRYFLARKVPLYSAYMFDDGSSCPVLPGRYFASVNGNMIWSGQALAQATGKRRYLMQAIATARAVQAHLSDPAGVFADLQADNDIVGPLVEAMYALGTSGHQAFAVGWLMANASAAGADDNALGEFGRFFDGPAPTSLATAWQMDGGIALAQAAAALDPGGRPSDPGFWAHASFVPDEQSLPGRPVRVAFTGRAIAIMGTIGAQCCVAGHADLFVDGVRTFNRTGIWQGYSSPSRRQDNQVLFAWRWPVAGRHVITVRPAAYDGEEGGTFFQMTGYFLVP